MRPEERTGARNAGAPHEHPKEDGPTPQDDRERLNPGASGDGLDPERSESQQGSDDSDSVASKLSRELSNWRRRRTTSRPARSENSSPSYSDAARTIKVRGHETLVVRKPKLAGKPGSESSAKDE